MAIIFVITVAWVVFVAIINIGSDRHDSLADAVIATVETSASAVPLIVALVLSGAEALGGASLITHYHLEKFKQKLRREGREQGEAIGREQGLEQGEAIGREQGRKEAQATWEAWEQWNQRREQAERSGRPFDESPPAR